MNFDAIKYLGSVDPNEVCLKDVNPIIEVLKKRKERAKKENTLDAYIAFGEVISMLEFAPRIGAEEFVKMQTGKTLRELAEELPLHEVLNLIDKLYYEYQLHKMEGAETNDKNAQ